MERRSINSIRNENHSDAASSTEAMRLFFPGLLESIESPMDLHGRSIRELGNIAGQTNANHGTSVSMPTMLHGVDRRSLAFDTLQEFRARLEQRNAQRRLPFPFLDSDDGLPTTDNADSPATNDFNNSVIVVERNVGNPAEEWRRRLRSIMLSYTNLAQATRNLAAANESRIRTMTDGLSFDRSITNIEADMTSFSDSPMDFLRHNHPLTIHLRDSAIILGGAMNDGAELSSTATTNPVIARRQRSNEPRESSRNLRNASHMGYSETSTALDRNGNSVSATANDSVLPDASQNSSLQTQDRTRNENQSRRRGPSRQDTNDAYITDTRNPSAIHYSQSNRPTSIKRFEKKPVCNLECRYCDRSVCNRAMKAILLADVRVELFSTDFIPMGVQLVDKEYMTPNCDCRILDVACLGCGNVVGYHVSDPCASCLTSNNNGHFWMFHSEGIKAHERMNKETGQLVVWADILNSESTAAQVPCEELVR